MELKQYIDIFKKQLATFFTVLLLSIFVAFVWQVSQPEKFQATLLLNIGRGNLQNTEQYTYDSFYRLQADERFADTIVRWLGTPRIVEDIYALVGSDRKNTEVATLKNIFEAKRLSSQMIEVVYADTDRVTLERISASVVTVVNDYAGSLNQESKNKEWFVVLGSDPVIRDARVALPFALGIGLLFGIFIGFWIALFCHYFRKSEG